MTVSRPYDAAELRRLDVAHHLPPQADWAEIEALGGSRVVVRAHGCRFEDAEGRSYLDGMAGLWCVAVGYGRRELAEAARDQMLELAFYNSFFKTATAPPIALAARIAGLLGGDLRHVFFANSGSEANDTAFRLVRHYWASRGEPQRQTFIARRNAYHGSTVAGASLGGMAAMHAQGGLPIPGIVHIDQPYWYGEGGDMTPDAFGRACARALEDAILAVGPDKVAAFIAEPVQGAGGVIIPPDSYWPAVDAVLKKHGVLFVADEVICGFGRLGEWFGFQHYGLTPDVVTMAKALSSGYLPISACAVSARIVATLKTAGEFAHGYTYSSHPVTAAVALKNLDILQGEGLVARTREVTGPHLARALATLDDHPLVGETRALGLIGAVEITADKAARTRFGPKAGTAGVAVRDRCIARGLMVRAIRDTIVMAPPLVITTDEIDELVAILRAALDDAAGALA